jgi:hypothetical protein
MKALTQRIGLTLAGAGLLAVLAPLASATPLQDGGDGEEPVEINPFNRSAQQAVSPQQEMIELFHSVERRLNNATGLLFDASKGDVSKLEDLAASGIEELLRDAPKRPTGANAALASLLHASKSEGDNVLEDIDKIIELANQQGNGT